MIPSLVVVVFGVLRSGYITTRKSVRYLGPQMPAGMTRYCRICILGTYRIQKPALPALL